MSTTVHSRNIVSDLYLCVSVCSSVYSHGIGITFISLILVASLFPGSHLHGTVIVIGTVDVAQIIISVVAVHVLAVSERRRNILVVLLSAPSHQQILLRSPVIHVIELLTQRFGD